MPLGVPTVVMSVCMIRIGVIVIPMLVFGLCVCRIDQSDRSNRRRKRGNTKDIPHVIT